MDKPENYYATLGVPLDADSDTIKRAYRQLARRYHPDLAGPDGVMEMKRINRAYSVLSDPERRRNYDIVVAGVVDLRGFARPRPRPHTFNLAEDGEFEGLRVFSTQGPLRTGPLIHSSLGVVSALSSVHTGSGLLIAAGSLDGKGALWQIRQDKAEAATNFAADPSFPIESLRELRFSEGGALLSGWGRLHLHIWDTYSGTRLWSHELTQRAVSAHYSLDMALQQISSSQRQVCMALPLLPEDGRAPNAWGVRGTDVITRELDQSLAISTTPCIEEGIDNRRFWAIRMRALARDCKTLVTLSCALVPQEEQQMAIVRRWDLAAHTRIGGRPKPQITTSILVGDCAQCTPPYAITPDAATIAFVSFGHKIMLCDTTSGSYSEVASGTMGGSSRLALSPDGKWLAVAREDSEINEGVIDLWSVSTNQILQKLYHPWQISALHFAGQQLVVALTDGTIQVWQ